mmetsp:Transcript_50766/g.91159  ORF Transcript_50766/g.91159 Transcript_50766/m.91159 type:complete len:279 (+) Transcript_50766:51-887(+)
MACAIIWVALLAAFAAAEVTPEDVEACVTSEEDQSIELLQVGAKRRGNASGGPESVFCEKVPACAEEKLEGYCCPAASGTNLGCCFSGQVAEKHSCLRTGRASMTSCPAHTNLQELKAEDVEALCTEDCASGLVKLATRCRVEHLPNLIKQICSNPQKYAASIKKRWVALDCVNAKLSSSKVCPPNVKIVRSILQSKRTGDMDAICNSACHDELQEVSRECHWTRLSHGLTRFCKDHASLLETESLLVASESAELAADEFEELVESLGETGGPPKRHP